MLTPILIRDTMAAFGIAGVETCTFAFAMASPTGMSGMPLVTVCGSCGDLAMEILTETRAEAFPLPLLAA